MDARDGDDVDAQADADADPGQQGLLTEAAESPTVRRERAGADDGDDRALKEWAADIRRGESALRDDLALREDGDAGDAAAAWVARLRTGSRLRDGDGVDDAHRERVHASTEHGLTEHADVLQRLKDADDGNDADDGTTE